MKRIIIYIICTLTLFIFAGCGRSDEASQAENEVITEYGNKLIETEDLKEFNCINFTFKAGEIINKKQFLNNAFKDIKIKLIEVADNEIYKSCYFTFLADTNKGEMKCLGVRYNLENLNVETVEKIDILNILDIAEKNIYILPSIIESTQ